jgi:hypothetical protein
MGGEARRLVKDHQGGRAMKRMAVVVLGLFLLIHAPGVWAQSGSTESTAAQIGYGTGSVVGSAIYFPVKATFCLLGGLGSIYTRIFVGPQTTHELVSLTCRGTWAVTPGTLKGEEGVEFIGDVPPYAADPEREMSY